jgi:hypothetical protein
MNEVWTLDYCNGSVRACLLLLKVKSTFTRIGIYVPRLEFMTVVPWPTFGELEILHTT